jgi:hypothetical protein
MKLRHTLVAILATGMISIGAAAMLQQGNAKDPMEAFLKSMMPGPEQEWLAKRAGTWEIDMKFWAAPDTPLGSGKVRSTATMSFGGRILVTKSTGIILGMEYEGMGFSGHDNAAGQFFNCNVGSMGTGQETGNGTRKGDTLTMTSYKTDPSTGKPVATRVVETFEGDDEIHGVAHLIGPGGADLFKVAEFTAKRVK